jgi:hypothetical protein
MGREKPKRSTLYAAQQYLIEGLHNTGPTKATRLLAEFMNPAEIFEQIFWMQHRPSKKQLAMNPWVWERIFRPELYPLVTRFFCRYRN